MKLIREKFKKTYGEIDEVLRSKEFGGEDKIFVGMVTDLLAANLEPATNELKEVI